MGKKIYMYLIELYFPICRYSDPLSLYIICLYIFPSLSIHQYLFIYALYKEFFFFFPRIFYIFLHSISHYIPLRIRTIRHPILFSIYIYIYILKIFFNLNHQISIFIENLQLGSNFPTSIKYLYLYLYIKKI